jgi:hypothetical protein
MTLRRKNQAQLFSKNFDEIFSLKRVFSPPKSNSIKTSKSSLTKKNSNNKNSKLKQEKITNFEPKQTFAISI